MHDDDETRERFRGTWTVTWCDDCSGWHSERSWQQWSPTAWEWLPAGGSLLNLIPDDEFIARNVQRMGDALLGEAQTLSVEAERGWLRLPL